MTAAQFDADLVAAGLRAASSGEIRAGAAYSGGPAPPPRTLWQILEATAERFPRAVAIDDGRSVLDYLGLLQEVRRVGDRLASVGIGGGDRVGIRVSSGTAELYLSILAVLSVGAAYVPVDVDDPHDRAELVWSAAGVCAIVGDGGEWIWREVRPAGAGARRPVPGDDAWIIFTSGTTGTPKGVAVTHRNAAAFVDAEARLFLRGDPLGPGDRVLADLLVAFDASCEEMWLAWRHGACLVPAPRSVVKTGPELVTWLAQRRVSVVSTVPAMTSLWPADSLHGIRLLVLGGEACPSALADRLVRQGREVWNTYGPTEVTVVSCGARLSGGEPVRIGLPLDGWRLAVVDPASGQPVRWGEAGELVIGGAFLASVFLAAMVLSSGYSWISASSGWAALYLRSLAFSAGAFSLLCGLPILAKWTLVGRWKPQQITIWSLPYLRFWLVKTLVQADPLALFTGSPIYPVYLRALGARIGRRVVIFSRTVPVCTVIRQLTNVSFYLELTGDSSYVVPYLRALGYRLPDFEQTGSNFGADLEHETPFLIDIGRGTMIADGATLIDADYSSTSFRVTPLSIGPRAFLGNAVAYPAGGRTGENCLIATKAMVPLDGPVRANVGLLGSPCFEIPRSVTSDPRFDHLRTGEDFRRRLRAKNRHNLDTMGPFLAVRWVHAFVITLLAMAAWELYRGNGVLVLAGLTVATLLFSLAYFITVERALMRFRTLRPQYCSIYDPYFWWHERYWKLTAPLIGMLNGTPFKSPVWRLAGVRIGRRVFDDGCSIAERTLVTIGDECTLNAGSVIQCHSMEDGIFKADFTVLEDGCTLGTGALVHYDVTMGQGAQLQPAPSS